MRNLRCAGKTLSFQHPRIMGVLNITPDSFFDGGKLLSGAKPDLGRVRELAHGMVADGASVLDIGGESTRPGATPVSIREELERVIPVLHAVADVDTIVSVDTRHAQVAKAAIDAGAHLVNDISAGADAGMFEVIADSDVGYALMHMQGLPQTMQRAPSYQAVVVQISEFLQCRYQQCVAAGIDHERLMFDPGFGFGKTVEHNMQLLANLAQLRVLDRPLLVGLSRKSTLGAITGRAVQDRVHASVAAALIAVQHGADLLRVHDVAATQDALKLYSAVKMAQ